MQMMLLLMSDNCMPEKGKQKLAPKVVSIVIVAERSRKRILLGSVYTVHLRQRPPLGKSSLSHLQLGHN